jgi:3-isopropylmalate/(R)-2-methylmalate dehydratase small subunit
MDKILSGSAWLFGDDLDTDAIIPARYLNTSDPDELASHCMEDVDPDFPKKVSAGDIIIGGKNFGCGSSREHAPIAIKAAGVSCVIAGSYARGDKVEVDPATGVIRNLSTGAQFNAEPYPPFMMDLIEAGGLIPFLLKEQPHG